MKEYSELLRIENGIPSAGKELSEQINPLEARLESQISFTKGCYIGQEVIARIDTYKSFKRKFPALLLVRAMDIFDGGNRIFSNRRRYRLDHQFYMVLCFETNNSIRLYAD